VGKVETEGVEWRDITRCRENMTGLARFWGGGKPQMKQTWRRDYAGTDNALLRPKRGRALGGMKTGLSLTVSPGSFGGLKAG